MKISGKAGDDRAQWFLEAVADANREWMVAIDKIPFAIGRDTSCQLNLTDKWISRFHAEIRISGGHPWIRDLGSKNGTFINQKQISQAELLEPGDSVSIGKFKFIVKRLTPDDAAPRVEDTCFLAEQFAYSPELEARLRNLIASRDVTPHFQPVLNLSDQAIIGYEILGRINDQELPEDPVRLFGMADWFGCVFELSALFREAGLEKSGGLPDSPLLFVNIAPAEINQMDLLLGSLEKMRHLAPVSRVVTEINERAVNNIDEMMRLRDALKKFSMGLAFDDFGVGQTRLLELAKVPPDFLKFDISLVRNIHLAPKRLHQMIATFIKAAQDLGITTIAEGVECAEESEVCGQLGFNLAQGFFYGKPQPISD